jgi:TPR repeat protein
MAKLSTTKLIIVAVLGLCALVLGSVVLTLQSYVTQKRLNGRGRMQAQQGNAETEKSFTSTRSSNPTSPRDLHLAGLPSSHAFPPPHGAQWKTVGEAYWRHAVAFLKDWDVVLEDDDSGFMIPSAGEYTSTSTTATATTTSAMNRKNATATPRLALELAAQAGHPLAQLYLANAHASGIWPVTTLADKRASTRMMMEEEEEEEDPEEEELHVFDEWTPTAHGDHPQVTKAFVLWHMAAMAGSIDAAMALAYRLDNDDDINDNSNANANANSKCTDVLPYYEAAANGILDELESSLHSRAKVLPPMDRHTLAQVHMHGGTSSQLHWHDKPDESKEALQFYHLKATTIPWSMTSSNGGGDNDDSSSSTHKEAPIDVNAAFTLGHLYQHGIRGVEQNLTLSLQYYEIAASYGHWESAGEAGTFHLWGMGTPQNVHEALVFFRLGAAPGMDGCKRRHDQVQLKVALSASSSSSSDQDLYGDVVECDHQSLNGLGLLHLLGIPDKLEVDLPMAEKLFTLAKEMGNADAMYNLAMMWLGWKTHYKRVEDLKDGGMSQHQDHASAVFPGGHKEHLNVQHFALHISQTRGSGNEHNFKGPSRAEIQEAIKSLTLAANKGHVQAKHRLGMIYAQGIQIQTTAALTHDAVKKDCNKARGLFQWIAENASLSRSKRLRKAYKEYIAGDLETSVRNYLAAAETGSSAGQVNAAFLFERGTCLGLAPTDCAKASVRLWKAAAARGHAEACLRVGDFYYYGRLRGNTLPTGPFGWVQYVLYPEEYLPEWIKKWGTQLWSQVYVYRRGGGGKDRRGGGGKDDSEGETETETETKSEQEDTKDEKELVEADLAMAAHYYTVAVEKHHSPRANFNLGFMHEWGFGLKQDFPLAKRHYDLAASNTISNEADLAVQIALMAMNSHETFVKLRVVFDDWWNGQGGKASKKKKNTVQEDIPESPPAEHQVWHPVPATERIRKTQQGVIFSHIFNWSSLVIVVLLYVVHQLMQFREHQRRR